MSYDPIAIRIRSVRYSINPVGFNIYRRH